MHTVAEVGFWNNPRVIAFSTKVKNPDAGAWLLRLREFVLTQGTDDGRLPGFTADEIAAIMRPTCPPRILFDALKRFNQLKQRRRTWFVPEWKKSPMGKYCEIRKWDRERKQEFREARHQARIAGLNADDDERTSIGRPQDVVYQSSGNLTVSKQGRPTDVPPGPPQKGGREAALTRWEWFKDVHPRLKNPDKCKRELAKLTSEEWDHLQFALPKQVDIYMSRGRRWTPWADKYLEQHMFLELPRETPRSVRQKQQAKKEAAKVVEPDPKTVALKYLLGQLSDPDITPSKKEKVKEQWFKSYGDKPWEK